MLCLDDKLYQDDVLMILEELEVQNSHLNLLLLKTTFRQKSLSTSGKTLALVLSFWVLGPSCSSEGLVLCLELLNSCYIAQYHLH